MFTLSLGFITFFTLAYRTFSEDKKLFVMELNLSILKTALSETKADLKSRIDELQTFLPKIYESNLNQTGNLFRELSIQYLPGELVGVRFYRRNESDYSYQLIKTFTNTELLDNKSLPRDSQDQIEKNHPAPLKDFSFSAGTVLLNRSLKLSNTVEASDLPVLSFLIPGTFVNDNTKSMVIVVDLIQTFLQKKLQQSEVAEVFLITKSGSLLSHASTKTLIKNTNIIFDHPIVEKLKTRQLPKESLELVVNKESYLCNLSESGLPDTYGISQIKKSEAFQALKTLMRETLLTGLFIFSIALILSIIFANRLTSNIKKLKGAAEAIGHGDLNLDLNIKSNDEIQSVAESFTWMSSRIKELIVETVAKARMAQELETAKLIQDTLLSSPHIDTDAVEVSHFYLSASECGGDVWDAYLCGNKLTILVGDATGHGAPAAIVTAVAKSCFATLNAVYNTAPLSPEIFLEQLNRVIYDSCKGQLLMTMAAIQIDLHTGEAVCSNAGHESPLLLKPEINLPDSQGTETSKARCEALFVRGERLGFSPDSKFERLNYPLQLGDSILIYTDGVSEATNTVGKQYGERAIKKLLNRLSGQPLTEINRELYSSVKEFMGEAPQLDDITYVLLKWNRMMEKITLSVTPNRGIEPVPSPNTIFTPLIAVKHFEEVDYSIIHGEQIELDLSATETFNQLTPRPSTPVLQVTSEFFETLSALDKSAQRVIPSVEREADNRSKHLKLKQLAKNTDFTERAVDRHYARIEMGKKPKTSNEGSSGNEAA